MKKTRFLGAAGLMALVWIAGCSPTSTTTKVDDPTQPKTEVATPRPSSMMISSAQQMVDKAAPEVRFADARGVPKNLKLADLKGQYVLMEFWGFWCGPCIQYGIPEVMAFHDRFGRTMKGKLTILAVHEGSRVNTIKEVLQESQRAKQEVWKRDLPFPIVCDTDDQNVVRAFKIDRFPTKVLIDPAGKVISINPDLDSVAEWAGLK